MREQIFVEIKLNKRIAKNKTFCSVSPRGVLLLLILVGGVPPGSPNPDPISDRKMSFSRPVFRPSLMLVLLKLERKQKKNSLNSFRFSNSHISLSLISYSFGIETINTFIHSVVPSKTIPDSRPKWAKCILVFRPKRPKNPTRWGGKYLYSLYEGVPPPPRVFPLSQSFIYIFSMIGLSPGNTPGIF